jgi:hypothetical protein
VSHRIRPWLAAIVILTVLLVVLVACGGGGNPLVGKWQDQTLGLQYEFTADGKLTMGMSGMTLEGTYELTDSSHVKITVADFGEPVTLNFTISGDKLTLSDDTGQSQELVRVP